MKIISWQSLGLIFVAVVCFSLISYWSSIEGSYVDGGVLLVHWWSYWLAAIVGGLASVVWIGGAVLGVKESIETASFPNMGSVTSNVSDLESSRSASLSGRLTPGRTFAAVVMNFAAPGLGSMYGKRWLRGFLQFVAFLAAVVLNLTLIGAVIGVPIAIVVWLWAQTTSGDILDNGIERYRGSIGAS